MEKSESITKLAGALAAFQGEVENVKKDSTNPFFKSKYASLENVISTVKPLLAKNGLSYSQRPSGENELSTILMHLSGEWIGATAKMTPKDSSPQAQGSAMTYMRRYALSALLGLATEDDDDGNEASKPVKKTWQAPHKQEEYDQSPIADDAPVIVAAADEAPKFQRTEKEKKARVKALLDKQSLTDLKTKTDYEEACLFMTDLVLAPEN